MSARKEKPKTPQVLKVTHVRRCHVCGTVNESEESVNIKCQECGKHLAPFYYFDESKLDGLEDDGLYLSKFKSATGFNLIYGFSHYWVEEISVEEIDSLGQSEYKLPARHQQGYARNSQRKVSKHVTKNSTSDLARRAKSKRKSS